MNGWQYRIFSCKTRIVQLKVRKRHLGISREPNEIGSH